MNRRYGTDLDGCGVVGDADGRHDVLDDGVDGGVGVSLGGAVGEVTPQAVVLDDGGVELRGADDGGGGEDGGTTGQGEQGADDHGDLRVETERGS